MPTPETLADELTCGECGRVSRTDEPGWRAYLTTDEAEPAEGHLLPACAEREFET